MTILKEVGMNIGINSYYVEHPAIRFQFPINIGNYTSIAYDVAFVGGNHACVDNPDFVSTYPFAEVFKIENYPRSSPGRPTTIGNDVWICAHARILSGVTIHDGAIIAAGSVVTKDVCPYAIVAGNPAEFKKLRFTTDIVLKLLKIKWWEWSPELIKERIEDFKDVNKFVDKYGGS